MVVAGRETALLESGDGGRTFSGRQVTDSAFPLARPYPAGHGFYLDGELVVFSSDGTLLHRGEGPLDDAGSHARIAALPGIPRVAWAAGAGGIERTHDGGQSWTPVVREPRGASAVLIDGGELIYATLGRGVRHRPLVIGDLTIPRVCARYDNGELVGRVLDHRPGESTVAFAGESFTVDGDPFSGVSSVRADGRFEIPVGRLHGQ